MSIEDGITPGARMSATQGGVSERHVWLPTAGSSAASMDAGQDAPELAEFDLAEAAGARETSDRLAAARARDRTDAEIRLAQHAQRRMQAEDAARIAAEERLAAQERLAKESAVRLELECAATEAARLREDADKRAIAASLLAEDMASRTTRAAAERVDAELRAQAVADRRASLEQARARAGRAKKARRVVAALAMLAAFALGLVVASQWNVFRGVEETGFMLNDLRIDTHWEAFGGRRR